MIFSMKNSGKRKTKENNIIIICEGSDTEYLYFEKIMECVSKTFPRKFTKFRVLPDYKKKLSNNNGKKLKALLPSKENRKYYALIDEDEMYESCKAQPIRYVREAKLFMEREGYSEAWAVFDKDKYSESNHKKAFEIADSESGLHIAFSSYCFEEWFLLHFELNTKKFSHSECKDDNDKYVGCGGKSGSTDDCHGRKCIIGRLREENYISDYNKDDPDIFDCYTQPLLNNDIIIPFYNAALQRALSTEGKVYNRNPYTNVDYLIARLFEKPIYHCVMQSGNQISLRIDASDIECIKTTNKTLIIKNNSNSSLAYNESKIQYFKCCSKGVELLKNTITKGIILGNQSKIFQLDKNTDGILVRGKDTFVFFFKNEIPQVVTKA